MNRVVSAQSGRSFRFSLRGLLLAVAAISPAAAVARWNMLLGLLLAVAVAGAACVVIGVRNRQTIVVAIGLLLVGGATAVFVAKSMYVTTWVGRHPLRVHVLVVDGTTLAPIPDATVDVLNGPSSPMEGLPPDVSTAFTPADAGSKSSPLITNERGQVEFTHEFFAAGSDGIFSDSGYVDTGRSWIRVHAAGYRTTHLPIDGQSPRPRDIKRNAPVVVTVPLGKLRQ